MRLENQVAIVAGAAWGGIGGATALRFAQEGARLIVNTRSREAKLQETVARIEAIGGEAVGIMGDASQDATWEALIGAALERYGKLTRLVYSPAQSTGKRVGDLTRAEWDRGLEVTLSGAWTAARLCLPEMISAGGGAMVFISTVNSLVTSPHCGLYATAKAGLNAMVRSIALEYGREGIRANAIAPGLIVGERLAERMVDDPLEEAMNRDCYPVGRYGAPDDIANAALYLASDEASFVTGHLLVVDGGLTLQNVEALVRPAFRRRWRDDVLVPQKE